MDTHTRRAVAALLLLGVIIAVGWGLFASPGSMRPARVVTVGVYENAPKVYMDKEGVPSGLFIKLLRAIARPEHWSLRYVHCAWSDCLQRLAAGKLDLMPDVAFSPDRAKQFDFHNVPVAYSWSQVYRNSQVHIRSIPNLAGRRVAVLRGSIQQRYLAGLMVGSGLRFKPVLVRTYAEGFKAVQQGRADAVVTNTFFGARHARAYGLIETPIMFEPVSLYFATGKGRNAALLGRIDHYLATWRDDPDSVYFSALRRAMAPPPVTIVPSWLRVSLFSSAGVLLALLGFAVVLRWQVRRATAERDRTNRRLDQVLNASPVVLYRLHHEGERVVTDWVSPNIERVFGFSTAQAMQPGWWEGQLHPEDRAAVLANFARVFSRGQLTQEYRVIDAAGRTRHVRDELRMAEELDAHANHIVGTWSDLTESREQAAQLNFLTNHDPLTRLANRVLLRERLEETIARARRARRGISVLSIDLDRFKNINDTLGHQVGDDLLRGAAKRLESIAGDQDTLARVGGDEFVLVLGGQRTTCEVTEVAQRVLALFARPLRAGPHKLIATASVGIGVFPGDGEDADTLLKHAELALYEAKALGRNTFRFFASELSTGVQERLAMENALRGAVSRNELVLHYQPQIDLRTGALIGVEALVRWSHPELGLVVPARFIPLAEETGIIKDISAWVMLEACGQLVTWEREGLYVPRMAINLSVQQIEQEILASQVTDVLRETGLPATRLELEITESTIMREPDKAISALAVLKAKGVTLSVDDFGTGHSSLSYLKRLPLDRLKIDRSFVQDIGHDANDEAISRAVIGLARSLGLETVAEGVEREEQAAFLRAEGCEFAQGYLFSRPLPGDVLNRTWAGSPSPPDAADATRSAALDAEGTGDRGGPDD